MTEDSDTPRLGFRSAGSWTGGDLAQLAAATTGIYNAFLTARVRDRLEANYLEALESALRHYDKFMGHPFYHELFHAWRDALRYWRKQGTSSAMPPMLPPFFFGSPDLSSAVPTEEEIYLRLDEFTADEQHIHIYRIHHASPGGFSFEGIGEIIEQMRELIKDVWWRNRAERSRDELDLIDRYLKLRRENPDVNFPLPPFLRKDRHLAIAVQGHLIQLKALEERGKLEAVTQHLDYVPE